METMRNITNVFVRPLKNSKCYTMHFTQNGKKKTWDLLTANDSVAILVYNITRQVLVLVKQFRPALYFGCIPEEDRVIDKEIDVLKYPLKLGMAIGVCSGTVDEKLFLNAASKEKIFEQCNYDVPLSSLHKICSYKSKVGASSSLQTAYYCEVTDDMKVNSEGAAEETMETFEMTVDEVKRYVQGDHIPSVPHFMFLISWFLYCKNK